ERGARRGDAYRPEHGVGQNLAALRRVQRHRMKLQRREPVKLLLAELVEVDLQRAFQALRRCEVRDLPRVADADLLVRLAFRRELGLRPRELRAKEVPFAVA